MIYVILLVKQTEQEVTEMYVLKNSLKNLLRNKGRNMIVALIILAMLTFTAISMIINTATDRVIENYKQQFGSEIYLQSKNVAAYADEVIQLQNINRKG